MIRYDEKGTPVSVEIPLEEAFQAFSYLSMAEGASNPVAVFIEVGRAIQVLQPYSEEVTEAKWSR